ncbi:hypothetical protein D6D19_10429 [Aureobasidium pullulans]|uniref:Uncharacterized protein n=1 Tax=Aureobasidium pullulans TaxID=5580 RepID=A0A4S8YW79_AURPU|nr:hypothetical protein D6D19_10429 [Aureobasidium pullulans]
MSASQQPLAISPNANRLAVVYRHKFVVSSEHMEENEGQQGFARDQIRRRDEASPSSGIVQPRQVQRGRLNTGYGHVMPQKSIAAWPFLYVMLHTYGRISLKDQFEKRRNQTANFWKSQLLVLCPARSQPCGHATLTCQDSYFAGRPVAKLLGTNTANTWDEHEVSAFDWLHHSPEQTHLTSRTETSYK